LLTGGVCAADATELFRNITRQHRTALWNYYAKPENSYSS
jgi:hypothetical protein